MSNLFHFLTDLAANPQGQRALAEAPEAVMAAAGLTKMEQAAFQSGDSTKVTAVFADESLPLALCIREPDPDPSPDPDPGE